MDAKLVSLQVEVERLEIESQRLKERQRMLKNDEEALKHEASQYYLLTGDAKVIKFKEPIQKEDQNKVLVASPLPKITTDEAGLIVPKTPPIDLIRFFYVVTATLLSIGFYFKLKNSREEARFIR